MKNEDYWYPLYPTRFRRKTMHLTTEQRGAYRDLMDYYMETGEPLPDNDAALARICGLNSDSWAIAAAIVRPFFFTGKDGLLHHKTCDRILSDQDERRKVNQKKGKLGAETRYKKQEVDSHSQSQTKAEASPLFSTAHDKTSQDSAAATENVMDEKKFPGVQFTRVELDAAKPGDPAYDPEFISKSLLPAPWQKHAADKGFGSARIFKTWEKFMEFSGLPYSRKRWFSWIDRENL